MKQNGMRLVYVFSVFIVLLFGRPKIYQCEFFYFSVFSMDTEHFIASVS